MSADYAAAPHVCGGSGTYALPFLCAAEENFCFILRIIPATAETALLLSPALRPMNKAAVEVEATVVRHTAIKFMKLFFLKKVSVSASEIRADTIPAASILDRTRV